MSDLNNYHTKPPISTPGTEINQPIDVKLEDARKITQLGRLSQLTDEEFQLIEDCRPNSAMDEIIENLLNTLMIAFMHVPPKEIPSYHQKIIEEVIGWKNLYKDNLKSYIEGNSYIIRENLKDLLIKSSFEFNKYRT